VAEIKQSINPNDDLSQSYKSFVLVMLTITYVFNFIDRQILTVLQESIKKELLLSDTHLGFLSGLAFAAFYVTVGIPVARLSDKYNRRTIISISLGLWSAMTALCGAAANFVHLLLARIGVGVGESGSSPAAHSMISDYFSERRRATALSVYSTGIYIGILVGASLGGWLDQEYGWRVAFLMLGIPGVLFALIFFFIVKEPARNRNVISEQNSDSRDTFWYVFKYLLTKKSFIFISLGVGFHSFMAYALNFLPPFLSRVHEMSTAEAGYWTGMTMGIGGAIGALTGGYLADKLGHKDKRWYVKISGYGLFIAIPCLALSYLTSNTSIMLTALFIGYTSLSLFLAPSIAIVHSIVPNNMRAFSSAILFFVLNFIGLGLGPIFVGIVSDLLVADFGNLSLRWALLSTLFAGVISVICFFRAAKYVNEDIV